MPRFKTVEAHQQYNDKMAAVVDARQDLISDLIITVTPPIGAPLLIKELLATEAQSLADRWLAGDPWPGEVEPTEREKNHFRPAGRVRSAVLRQWPTNKDICEDKGFRIEAAPGFDGGIRRANGRGTRKTTAFSGAVMEGSTRHLTHRIGAAPETVDLTPVVDMLKEIKEAIVLLLAAQNR